MLLSIFNFLFKKNGWRIENDFPSSINSCVILAGPHTSNWDTVYALSSLHKLRDNSRFALKKELMFFPFGPFFKSVGAIAIDRKPKKINRRVTAIDAMADLFKTNKNLGLMISPEGTRSPVTKWRSGFYYVAKKANVPMVCAYLNYKEKFAGIGPVFYPSEDLKTIMLKVQQFYATVPAKYPENFKTAKL
jgi:1-acyl-sn-glycerol-3-phosphate acyltransferase